MKKIDYLSTLLLESMSVPYMIVISVLNFEQEFLSKMIPIFNAQFGAEQMISDCDKPVL